MIHNYCISYKNIKLRSLQRDDIEKLRVWRNDEAKTKYLRKIGQITPEMQQRWYKNYLQDQNMIIFAIEETERLKSVIGSIALYDFHSDTAEIGKVQIGEGAAVGQGWGKLSVALAALIGFSEIGLKTLVVSVHRDNLASYNCFINVGFTVTGFHDAPTGGIEDEMRIDREAFYLRNSYLL